MVDETIRQLDQLFQAERARREGSLALLRSVVQRLEGPLTPDPEPLEQGGGRGAPRGVTTPAVPFVPLPQRTTPGGRWGPAVRAKLRSEALAKR
jgi:hypothetical protein